MPVCIRLAAKTMWLMARFRVLLAFVLLVSHPGALIAHQAFFTASAAHIGPDGAVTIRVRFDLLAYALNDTSARIGNEPMEELLNGPRALLEKPARRITRGEVGDEATDFSKDGGIEASGR